MVFIIYDIKLEVVCREKNFTTTFLIVNPN